MAFIVKDNLDEQDDGAPSSGSVASTSNSGQDDNKGPLGSSASEGPTPLGPSNSSGAPLGTDRDGDSTAKGGTPGTTGVAGSNPETQTQRSSGFTNLRDYLNVNSDQGGGLASNISSKINSGAQNAQSQLSDDVSKFNAQAADRSFSYDPEFLNSVLQDPSSIAKSAPAVSANSLTTSQPSGVQELTNYLNASYNGPQSLDSVSPDLGDIQNKITNSQNAANLTKTEGGRQALLSQQYSTPNYSTGQQYLDQMLLENTPQGKASFSDLRNNLSGLGNVVSAAQQTAADTANNNANIANYARQEAQLALGGPNAPKNIMGAPQGVLAPSALTPGNDLYSQFQTALTGYQNKLATDNSNAWRNYDQVMTALDPNASGTTSISPDELRALGLSDNSRYSYGLGGNEGRLYGADIRKFITQNDYKLANILTPAEYGQLQDINTLLSTGGVNTNLAGLVDPSQLGTYSPKNIGFTVDTPSIQAAVNKAQNAYVTELTNPVNDTLAQAINAAKSSQHLVDDFPTTTSPTFNARVALQDPVAARDYIAAYITAMVGTNQGNNMYMGDDGYDPQRFYSEIVDPIINQVTAAYDKAYGQYGNLYNDNLSNDAVQAAQPAHGPIRRSLL